MAPCRRPGTSLRRRVASQDTSASTRMAIHVATIVFVTRKSPRTGMSEICGDAVIGSAASCMCAIGAPMKPPPKAAPSAPPASPAPINAMAAMPMSTTFGLDSSFTMVSLPVRRRWCQTT